ncbi:MAG: transcriptional regulator [Anaerolineae bacterium]|nr:transcriptional regulator [Anaerolineae bacterium]
MNTSDKSFSDIASKIRSKRTDQAADEKPRNFEELYLLRARILGVLIRDARQAVDLTPAACAKQIDVPLATLNAWELGQKMPSLPQLELLSYTLNVPISHFWGTETLLLQDQHGGVNTGEYVALRTRLIGALLRQARQNANLTEEALAAEAGIAPGHITAYELGQRPIPTPILVSLASACRVNLSYFLENGNRIGTFLLLQEDLKHFSDLPEEVRRFVSAPVNQPFIELAMKIAQLGSDELRTIATSILDITL